MNNESEIRVVFASSLRRWRHHRGFSQEELAERANLHRTYISDVERGARNLSLESINRLAKALEISIPTLFTQESPDLHATPSRLAQHASEFVDILLVEDDPDDVHMTLQAFTKARFANSVRVFRDGIELLEHFFSKGEDPKQLQDRNHKIILLDLNLPKIGGIEVLRRLKLDSRTREIPVVILTASDKHRDIDACLKLGAVAFITKPVNLQGLGKVTPQLNLTWALIKCLSSANVNNPGNVRSD